MGRDIVALKVTQNAKARTDNTRPAVLYNAMQHAREWLAGETCKRSLNYFTTNYGKTTPDGVIATELVNTRELWFVCVNNPDGYEYTFTPGNRLWRKNMDDNNGNGVLGEPVDGVDINRNHATHWGFDNEGSSDDFLSETYRGAGPDSEPETKAIKKLWGIVNFVFNKNDHTAAELLLWPNGFQQYTPVPDDKLFEAYAGDDAGRRSPTRSTTRTRSGRSRATASIRPQRRALHHQRRPDRRRLRNGILAYTPEGSQPNMPTSRASSSRTSRPTSRREFLRHKQFVLDLARSADDPGEPDLAHGQHGRELLRRDLRGLLRRPTDRAGRGQEVARRRQAALPDQRRRGEDRADVEVPRRRALRPGARPLLPPPARHDHRDEPGDEVDVWFEGGRKSSPHFTYTARAETGAQGPDPQRRELHRPACRTTRTRAGRAT